MIIADLHIHSKYSRATSRSLDIQNLEKYARIKGINLLGTGDFAHPLWIQELKENLKEENGILKTKTGFNFVLQNEISLMYSQDGKGRRVHLVILAPSFDIVNQITEYLKKKGRVDYDGRPIFNISCVEFTEKMMEINKDIEIIPAHCLLPDELIHTNYSLKKIKEIKGGDSVYTHKNNWKKVKEVLKRDYSGKIIKIIPWYFIEGLSTTPEHPFYTIKSYKNCRSTRGLCKKGCSMENACARKYYLDYTKEWVKAKDLEKGDFLVYPRFNQEEDIISIKLTDFIKNYKPFNKNFLLAKNSRNNRGIIKNNIVINQEFCKLIGYFLSEGYLIEKEAIGFSFNSKEKEYIKEVIDLIKIVFGVSKYKIDSRRTNQADIIFYSHILNNFFKIFYIEDKRRAGSKSLPNWLITLPNQKLAEIFRCWWRGDTGVTASRNLANQMKLICLKLGIIPSISIESAEKFNARGKKFIGLRKIIANHDIISFRNLSFFENDYGMLKENCFKKFVNIINRKHGFIDENYIYLPIREIKIKEYCGCVYNLEVEEDNSYVSEFACVHNCLTPWFGIFGSATGFDSLKECFKDEVENIHAIETGMSADPKMLWKLSFLNDKTIMSSSDSHSFWPWRVGREATIFSDVKNYKDLIKQIREDKILGTIETDPGYGKYHYDGHRLCNFSCSPQESQNLNNICPVCKKQLTIGVENRIEKLTDQTIEKNPNRKHFYKILPLSEIIAAVLGKGIATRTVWVEYNKLINEFKNEFNILLNVKLEELKKITKEKLANLIIENREGKIKVKPGYDGVYGIPIIDEEKQISLGDF